MNVRARRPRRRTALALLVALCVAAGAVVVITRVMAPRGPALDFGGGDGGSAAGAMLSVPAQTYGSAYFGSACLSEPGQVTIRSIQPVKPRGGLKITDFAVVPRPGDDAGILGASNKRLRDELSFRGGVTATATCATDDYVDLFVEVYKPGAKDVTADDFIVTYDSDGDRRTVPLHYGFSLCDQDECTAG